MNHLLKLKKDGQDNYIKFENGKLWYSGNNKDWFECNENFDVTFWLRYDSIHPFVCKDKNGDEVFADDEVDSIGNRCRVMWHKAHLQWCLWHIEGDYYFGAISKRDIELIKDA